MCRIREGFAEEHLSNLFHISLSTVSRIVISWVNFMCLKFVQINIWLSRTVIDNTMPEAFKAKYSATRVITDCTEVQCQMPSSLQFYSDTTTKCIQHFTRYNAYCKLKVMRGIILFKTVRAFGFKIEPSLITCCYNFVKIFILKKNLCFPQVGWNACAVFVGDFFTRIYNVLVHFSLCKQWHFLKRSTPVFFRIFYRSNLTLAGKVTSSRLGQRKFSSRVQLIWIGIHDLFIFTILDEFFDSVKKY